MRSCEISDIVIVLLVILLVGGLTCAIYEGGYRRGQIDAQAGKIEYRLVEHPDGTKTWERGER